MKSYYIYILTNKNNTVLYTGVTNSLEERLEQHRLGQGSKFVKKYNVSKMIYAEEFSNIEEAIAREKQIKSWKRKKKDDLINNSNPKWEAI